MEKKVSFRSGRTHTNTARYLHEWPRRLAAKSQFSALLPLPSQKQHKSTYPCDFKQKEKALSDIRRSFFHTRRNDVLFEIFSGRGVPETLGIVPKKIVKHVGNCEKGSVPKHMLRILQNDFAHNAAERICIFHNRAGRDQLLFSVSYCHRFSKNSPMLGLLLFYYIGITDIWQYRNCRYFIIALR